MFRLIPVLAVLAAIIYLTQFSSASSACLNSDIDAEKKVTDLLDLAEGKVRVDDKIG